MKKFARVLTAVCVMVFSVNSLSFAGTWERDSAWMSEEVRRAEEERQFLWNAVDRTLSLDSMAGKSTMTLYMEGQDSPVTVSSDLKFRNRSSGDLKYLVELHTEKAGAAEDVRLFYSEGYYCMDGEGQRLKAAMDLQEAREELNYDPNSIGLSGLESIQNLQISDDGNGNKRCTFSCDTRVMNRNDYFYGVYQQMGLIWADVEVKEMKGSFLVNQEGYCTAQTMDIALDVTVDETTAAADIKIDIVYMNPGQPVQFALPPTEEYTEV